MRAESKIKHQLRQVTFRHLQKRLKANFKQKPTTCGSNHATHIVGDVSVGLCGVLDAEGRMRGVPCDSRIAGCNDMARQCPMWTPLQSKDEVKAEFNAIVQSGDRGIIASQFPDIAALLWVLDDDEAIPSEEDIDAAVDQDKPESWWGKLKKLGGG